jgi:tetratricopeptide (TPR) repeat protein
LIGAKQHSKALEAFSTMFCMDPENSEVLGMRGYCRSLLNDKHGALNDFNLVLEREPDSSRWYQHRACLRLSMNNKKQALLDYCRASELEPGNAETQEQVLRLALDLKDYQRALVSYNRLSLLPNFQSSYEQLCGRARLFILLGSYEKAISDLNRALKLKKEGDCVYLLAFCHSQLGDMAQAREYLTVASQSSPRTAKALLHQARIESSLGEDVSAVDHLSQALLLEPSNTAALVARGRLYQKREQWLSAREDFSKALTNAVADKEISESVAVCNKKIEQNAHISIVLPRPTNVDLTKFSIAQLRDNGERYYRQGNKSQACWYFREIVRRNPGDIDSQRNLAHCLNEDHFAAIVAFEQLAAVSKLTSDDIIAYSAALAGARQFDRAIQLLEQAREVEPGNSCLSIELVKLLASAGKKDEAIALCSASIRQQGIQRQKGPLQDLYVSLCHENRRSAHLQAEPLVRPETDG